MVAGENLLFLFLFGILINFNNDLCIIFYNQRQLFLCKNIFPKVVSHDAIRIWWISCSIVIAFIKWQKPAIFPSKLCAELDAGIINSKMHHAAFELEQHLSGITVILVLLNGIINILLCDLILEFKCNNWETIDKYAQIQCQFGCIL